MSIAYRITCCVNCGIYFSYVKKISFWKDATSSLLLFFLHFCYTPWCTRNIYNQSEPYIPARNTFYTSATFGFRTKLGCPWVYWVSTSTPLAFSLSSLMNGFSESLYEDGWDKAGGGREGAVWIMRLEYFVMGFVGRDSFCFKGCGDKIYVFGYRFSEET